MKRIVLLGLAAGLLALGCGDSTPSGASGAPAGSGAALADADVPVAADFEEEAEKNISAANYKSELDALEKDVDSAN